MIEETSTTPKVDISIKVKIDEVVKEQLQETFSTAESEGFSLDILQKVRTGD